MKDVQTYQTKQEGRIMLNANELYRFVDEAIMQEILQALPATAFHRYPDAESKALIAAYANVMQLSPEQILAGNGSDEMLGLMIGYFLGKEKKLYTLSPDFSMYDYYASMHEAIMVKYACQEDGSFDIDDFIKKGKAEQVAMIMFSNPNNPSGHLVNKKQLLAIVRAFSDIPVIVDEAYGEFAKESILPYIDEYPNLYVTRTLSKAFGLAGARLGFLISNQVNITALKPYVVPYNISSISQKIGEIVLQHADDYMMYVKEIIAQRELMFEQVKQFTQITFYPSQANYLYARSKKKDKLLTMFQEQGIVIRNYEADDTLRITIGSKQENEQVLAILKQFEKEESICAV